MIRQLNKAERTIQPDLEGELPDVKDTRTPDKEWSDKKKKATSKLSKPEVDSNEIDEKKTNVKSLFERFKL